MRAKRGLSGGDSGVELIAFRKRRWQSFHPSSSAFHHLGLPFFSTSQGCDIQA
jgi:hypothetical protein